MNYFRLIIKKVLQRWRGIQYIPFLNRIQLRSAKLDIGNSILYKVHIDCSGHDNSIQIGDECMLRHCTVHICGKNNKVVICNQVRAQNAEFWIEDDNNQIIIGENTFIAGKTHLACTEGQTITIGDSCLFSSDVVIRTGDSHSILDDNGKRINHALSVSVGNHVWVGNRVIICKGVLIPDDCVIGTAAVLTKKFDESNAIYAGIPARVIKTNINWDIERI